MRRLGIWAFWVSLLAVVTAAFLPHRAQVLEAQVALTYLLVVLGGSVSGGRALGLSLAVIGFLLIDYAFQPPFDRISVNKPVDWIVLLTFLATAVSATQLLARARAEAGAARERADEVASLARLGAETLNAGQPEDALAAVADVIRVQLGVATCHIEPETSPAAAGPDDIPFDARSGLPDPLPAGTTIRLRLNVRGHPAGVLVLADPRPILLSPPQRRFLETLAYYAALAAERVALVRTAEHVAALREASRLKDIVLASVSHDLRTPLAAVKALAADPSLEGPERTRAIEEQVDRLNRFVGDLLQLSKLEAGVERAASETNTAEDLLGALHRQLAPVLGGHELVMDIDLSRPALVGRFNFVHALRSLSNLVENAVRMSPAGVPVEVSVRREGDVLSFRVADRGPGVPAEDQGRIFEAFYRPAGTPVDTGRAGLGLSIARRLAELQGGTVSYEPRPGGGSIFSLKLPALDVEEAVAGGGEG